MKWISVKERLPDSCNELILVYVPKGNLYDEDYRTYHILMWYKNHFGEFHEEHMKKITHWMILPEEPK